MTTAKRILSLFHGRTSTLAVAENGAFHPQPIEGTIKPSWIKKEHLSGKRCLGFYLMTAESQVYCSAVDFDNKPDNPDPEWQDKAATVYYFLTELNLVPTIEISQSGYAAHVWLFFDEPVDAWLVRKFWDAVEKSCDIPFVEVYPRQDELSGKKLGNLIRYPLWKESRFVDVENEWAFLDPDQAMDDAKKTDATTLRMLIFQLTGISPRKDEKGVSDSGLPPRVERLVSRQHTLLGRRWQGDMVGLADRSNSALVLSIASELVRLYVPTIEIEKAIKVWCEQNNYDKGEREDWVSLTISKAYEFMGAREKERLSTTATMKDAVKGYLQLLRQGIPPCIASGIEALDASIDGVGPGEICVIAARPSHGKTAFALQWVHYAAFKGRKSFIISEEMSEHELGKRALLSISAIEEELWPDELAGLDIAVEEYYDSRAVIKLAVSCNTIDEVERQVEEQCLASEIDLVAVDYLQLLTSDQGNRYETVTDISRRLKQIATRNKIAMLVLCQLNRDVEKRDNKEPKLADLRESGQIEQDADLALLLQWPFRYDSNYDPEAFTIWCAKRRNGPIRNPTVHTRFCPERQRFG